MMMPIHFLQPRVPVLFTCSPTCTSSFRLGESRESGRRNLFSVRRVLVICAEKSVQGGGIAMASSRTLESFFYSKQSDSAPFTYHNHFLHGSHLR
jgi:hypothetical protein